MKRPLALVPPTIDDVKTTNVEAVTTGEAPAKEPNVPVGGVGAGSPWRATWKRMNDPPLRISQ